MQELKKTTFDELVKCCRDYDPFTEYIDSYRQQTEAKKKNELLTKKFNSLMQEVWKGYNRGIPVTNSTNYEKQLEDWLWGDGDRGITIKLI